MPQQQQQKSGDDYTESLGYALDVVDGQIALADALFAQAVQVDLEKLRKIYAAAWAFDEQQRKG